MTKTTDFGDVLTMRKTLERAKVEGLPLTMYSLRAWIRAGVLPAQKVNRKIYIYWPDLINFLICADGVGNAAKE